MATKFSQFTTGIAPVDATTFLVGYESVANTNNQYSKSDLATWLTSGAGAITTLYAADGTIGSGRVATVTDTLTFNNSSNQNILKISNEVCIGQLASANGNTTVAVGLNSIATGGSTTAVGSYAIASNGNSSAFGHSAQTAKIGALVIGYYSKSLGDYGVSVGYACGAASGTAANVVNIGVTSKGEGANSITFASNGSATAPTTANAFGVYMTSNTTPDFEVIGGAGAESTLNSSLKITGQGYTELHDTANTTLTVDWNNSNIQELTGLTGPHTFTASNPKAGATYILTLAQTGAVTATWTGVSWPGGTAPTLSGAGKTDVVTLICYDATGAGLYYGSATLDLA